jgi:demethylmenaquinone methyltransferase/2-methoxy-6-polyprenyl-1,4-benzoquinol methylase
MTNLSGTERAQYVRQMFAGIAERYDLMNRLMTFGQDSGWRRLLLQKAQLPINGRLLDLGTGTGDIAFAARQQTALQLCVGADFTTEMMQVGRTRPGGTGVGWTGADALNLPFVSNGFDAVVSGFLLRNVTDLPRALAEQYRVLKPGGCWVALDTTPPPDNWLKPFIQFHLHTVIPLLGKLITGQSAAYTYLPESTEQFLSTTALAEKIQQAGFINTGWQRLNFGTIGLQWGQKPSA